MTTRGPIKLAESSTAPPAAVTHSDPFLPQKSWWAETTSFAGAMMLSRVLNSSTLEPLDRHLRFQRNATSDAASSVARPSRQMVAELRKLFTGARFERFEDGVESYFSRELLRVIHSDPVIALNALHEMLRTYNAPVSAVGEALRWIADFSNAATLSQRWSILEAMLSHQSPVVRDGAIVGFATMDDPRSAGTLREALKTEPLRELRELIAQVLTRIETHGVPPETRTQG